MNRNGDWRYPPPPMRSLRPRPDERFRKGVFYALAMALAFYIVPAIVWWVVFS